MTNQTLRMSIAVLMLTSIFDCGHATLPADAQRTENSLKKGREVSSRASSPEVAVNSIEFFGWWWSAEQMAANFNPDNPPPKDVYIKLEQWNASSSNDFPHPDNIDIVCHVENKENQTEDFIVSATGDFKIASYKRVVEEGSESLEAVPWTGEQSIGQEIVRGLAPGESREVKFKGFNLRTVIAQYSGNKNKDLWPWSFRVRVSVETQSKTQIAQEQNVLDLIPAD